MCTLGGNDRRVIGHSDNGSIISIVIDYAIIVNSKFLSESIGILSFDLKCASMQSQHILHSWYSLHCSISDSATALHIQSKDNQCCREITLILNSLYRDMSI